MLLVSTSMKGRAWPTSKEYLAWLGNSRQGGLTFCLFWCKRRKIKVQTRLNGKGVTENLLVKA